MRYSLFKTSSLLALLLLLGGQPLLAQNLRDDGFQRRNGQMSIVRHGVLRPMTHDIHLPTGTVVTKDGFLISSDGKRTELREGQGCDLRGRSVAVSEAQGRLTLAPVAVPRAEDAARASTVAVRASLLDELLGRPDSDRGRGKGWYKKAKKGKHGRGKNKWRDDDDD